MKATLLKTQDSRLRIKRARILNPRQISKLFDHILDGFQVTHDGIEIVHHEGIVTEAEFTELLHKNATRLIARIREFKLCNNLTSIFFACLFAWCQCNGDDLQMRRARSRTGGRRNNDQELTIDN